MIWYEGTINTTVCCTKFILYSRTLPTTCSLARGVKTSKKKKSGSNFPVKRNCCLISKEDPFNILLVQMVITLSKLYCRQNNPLNKGNYNNIIIDFHECDYVHTHELFQTVCDINVLLLFCL